MRRYRANNEKKKRKMHKVTFQDRSLLIVSQDTKHNTTNVLNTDWATGHYFETYKR